MNRVDSAGVYIAEIVESAVSLTKNKYPQWVCRLVAKKKWIDDPAEMTHFKLTEPAYVDWSAFNEEMVGFFCLFKSADEFNDQTKLMNYDQLMAATGWDGSSFDDLADGKMLTKLIQARIQMKDGYTNPETGKTRDAALEITWIDSPEASPVRSLKGIDPSEVKALSAKLKIGIKTTPKTATPAKPAVATKPPVAAAPAPAPAPAPVAAPVAAAPVAAPKPPKKTKAPAPVAEPAPAPAPVAAPAVTLSATSTQMEAWEFVNKVKGANEDGTITDAWVSACGEVGGDKDEDAFTPEDWAKVRDIVIKDLDLKIAA